MLRILDIAGSILFTLFPAMSLAEEACEILMIPEEVRIVNLEEVRKLPEWQNSFTDRAKDWRYYEIVNETINVDQLDYRYIIVQNSEGRIIAIQPAFILNQDILEGSSEKMKSMAARIRKVWPGFLSLRTLMIGNSAGVGYLQPTEERDRAEAVRILSRHLTRAAKRMGVSLVVFKEFPREDFRVMQTLVKDGPFAVIPSLPRTMQDISSYRSFEEFHKAQSQNGRRQITKNLKASRDPGISPVTFEVRTGAEDSIDEIYFLYKQVFDRATQIFEVLTPEYFRELSRRMPDRVRFFIWKQDGKIIGMWMNLIEGDALLNEYVGLDYSVSKDLRLFFRMHYDMVDWAIQNGFKKLINSPTAYEYKRRFGHSLYPTDLYLAQTYSPLFDRWLKRFAGKMDPTVNEPELPKFPNFQDVRLPQ